MTTQETIGSNATSVKLANDSAAHTIWSDRPSRIGGIIVNDSAATLYVKFGADCAADDYALALAANTRWEMPRRLWGGIVSVYGTAGHTRHTEIY